MASGCQAAAPAAAGNERVKPEYDLEGRLTKLTFDRDGDGKIDTWGYMDGPRVVRVEVDQNGDGKPDLWEYHGANVSAPKPPASGGDPVDPTLERRERATKHDGRVSRREFFEAGILGRVEEDTDQNGKVDKWETYLDGSLSVMALDTTGRGRPDRRLLYRTDGTLDRIEVDPNGTGTFMALKK